VAHIIHFKQFVFTRSKAHAMYELKNHYTQNIHRQFKKVLQAYSGLIRSERHWMHPLFSSELRQFISDHLVFVDPTLLPFGIVLSLNQTVVAGNVISLRHFAIIKQDKFGQRGPNSREVPFRQTILTICSWACTASVKHASRFTCSALTRPASVL